MKLTIDITSDQKRYELASNLEIDFKKDMAGVTYTLAMLKQMYEFISKNIPPELNEEQEKDRLKGLILAEEEARKNETWPFDKVMIKSQNI